jgi:hypothetical protein
MCGVRMARSVGARLVIRKYYGRSIVALLLIPVVALLASVIFNLIDPEVARGHANYARNFALLGHLRVGVLQAGLLLLIALWLLACHWLVRAKSRHGVWQLLALLGPPGFAVLMALSDRSLPGPGDSYQRQLARVPPLLRVLYEVLRFVASGCLAVLLVDGLDYGTALLDAARRGLTLAQVLAERDASSGMWAFGDSIRAACLFVLIYVLWPAGWNALAGLIRWLRRRSAAGG